jgi:glucose-6-phosphate dehydrogenase assembly protein OpcA
MATRIETLQAFEEALFGDQETSMKTAAGSNTLKACLFTLIVLVKDMEHTVFVQDLVTLIAKKNPCKIIFVSVDTATKESILHKDCSTRTIGDSSANVICDIVSIHVGASQMHAIPFLIIPEIVPDLPVFMLLSHDPIEFQSTISQLEPYLHRIVVDIPHLNNIGQYSEHILSMHQRNKFVGLNWVRTKPWREALSHAFASKEALNNLRSARRVEIRYVHKSDTKKSLNPDTQAIMLQAWLATQLEWRPISLEAQDDSIRITYATNDREILVLLTPTDSAILDNGNVSIIEISADNDVHYLLSYEHDDKNIVVHASSQDRCEMPYALFVGSFQRGRKLPREIFHQKISPHYIPTLEMLASKIWQQDRQITQT